MSLNHFLRSVSEFSEMSDDELDILEGIMTIDDYPDGHEFIIEGQPGDSLFLIAEGEVIVSHKKGKAGRIVELNSMHAGELFGIIALIDKGERVATCTAKGPVRAAQLTNDNFVKLYKENSPVTPHLQCIIARQVMNDFRSLSDVVRNMMFTGRVENAVLHAHDSVLEYTGPDRRNGTRKGTESRIV